LPYFSPLHVSNFYGGIIGFIISLYAFKINQKVLLKRSRGELMKLRLPPVFELVAGTVHRTVPFEFSNPFHHAKSTAQKAVLFACERAIKRCVTRGKNP